MKKPITKEILIEAGIVVELNKNIILVKKDGKEIKREFEVPGINIEKKDNKIIISCKNATRRESKMIGTLVAHIKNMIAGLNEEWVYKLEICNVHFPMNVKAEKGKLIIKSFLGETTNRVANILDGVKVEVKGNQVVVSGFNKETTGQTAANIEKATRLTGRDRRIFQDGIFITEKCGRAI